MKKNKRSTFLHVIYTASFGKLDHFVEGFRPDNREDMLDHAEIKRRYERIKTRNPFPREDTNRGEG